MARILWTVLLLASLSACARAPTGVEEVPADPTTTPATTETPPPTDAPATTEAPPTVEGPQAPDFSLELVSGETFRLSEEQDPVYLVFWAEW